jgi:hypothetical protein
VRSDVPGRSGPVRTEPIGVLWILCSHSQFPIARFAHCKYSGRKMLGKFRSRSCSTRLLVSLGRPREQPSHREPGKRLREGCKKPLIFILRATHRYLAIFKTHVRSQDTIILPLFPLRAGKRIDLDTGTRLWTCCYRCGVQLCPRNLSMSGRPRTHMTPASSGEPPRTSTLCAVSRKVHEGQSEAPT